MQTQLVRGQSRRSIVDKVNRLSEKGWRLQGDIRQESGFAGSTRYAATMVSPADSVVTQNGGQAEAEDPRLTWAIGQIEYLQRRVTALEALRRDSPDPSG